jgi:hypothetical protein
VPAFLPKLHSGNLRSSFRYWVALQWVRSARDEFHPPKADGRHQQQVGFQHLEATNRERFSREPFLMKGRCPVVHKASVRLQQWAPAMTACLLLVLSITARADERLWYGSVYVSRQTDIRLPKLPYDIVTNNMRLENSYLASFGLARVVVPRFDVPIPFTGITQTGNVVEVEAQLAKHFGVEHQFEYVLAPLIRSGQIYLLDKIHFDIAAGDGISYMAPSYTSNNAASINKYHVQNYIAFEIEGTNDVVPDLHLVGRIHHRSGFYGLTSPDRYASNYLEIGLRFDLH